jgi:acyl dehydratase
VIAVAARFEDLEPGDEIPTRVVDLSPSYVAAYAREIGMEAARFTDPDGARREGLPGQIAPGNLTLALLARGLLAWAPGARLRRLGTTFRGLALAGTSAHLHGTVTEKDEARRSVECDLWMESAEGDRLVIDTATVEFP